MSDPYREADLHRLLAEDDGAADLGIEIRSFGSVVVMSGQVESPDRCTELERLVRQRLPDSQVVNHLVVTGAEAPAAPDEVS
jgi:hypothetical protein